MAEPHELHRAVQDYIEGRMKPLDLLDHAFAWMPEKVTDRHDPDVDDLAGDIFLP